MDQAKALFKRVSGIIQMSHWLLLTITVCSVTPAHAQSERERHTVRGRERESGSKGAIERGRGREGEKERPPTNITACVHLFSLIRVSDLLCSFYSYKHVTELNIH